MPSDNKQTKMTRYLFKKDAKADEYFEGRGKPKDERKLKMKDLFKPGVSTGARG